MAKTKEELEKLKQEKDSFMSKINELSDDELKQIFGGSYPVPEYFKNESDVTYLHNVGDIVEVNSGWIFGTVRCKVVDRRIVWHETNDFSGVHATGARGYRDEYKVQELEDHWYFYMNNAWVTRSEIQQ